MKCLLEAHATCLYEGVRLQFIQLVREVFGNRESMSVSAAPSKSVKDALIGQQVGNLRIVARIGQGGFGAVYRAEHVHIGTPYAIKVLRVDMKSDDGMIERFRREANTIAMLENPHVVRVTDFGALPDGGQFLAMELLSGKSLKEAMKAGRRFSLKEIRQWLTDVLETLHYIHSSGIVHRDIKPANLFLHRSKPHYPETIKILDFGIAVMSNGQSLTASGETIGSPVYMSPEQARGQSKYVDGRADLYSVGVILYQMLAGRPPFRGENFTATLLKQLQEPPPPLAFVCPDIPWATSLEDFLQKALGKQPEDRWPDASAMVADLQVALEEQEALLPEQVYPPPPPSATLEMPITADELEARRESLAENEQTIHTPSVRSSYLHTLEPMLSQVQTNGGAESGSMSGGHHTLGGVSLPETRRLKATHPAPAGLAQTQADLPSAGGWSEANASLRPSTLLDFPSGPAPLSPPAFNNDDILEAPSAIMKPAESGLAWWKWAAGGIVLGLMVSLFWWGIWGRGNQETPSDNINSLPALNQQPVVRQRRVLPKAPHTGNAVAPVVRVKRRKPMLPRPTVRLLPVRRRPLVRKRWTGKRRRTSPRRWRKRRYRRRIRRRVYRRRPPKRRKSDPFGGIEDPI
ncbi:MAG: serine/threonine protein kinase [Deltaproteobacteria bacterium]|nr:MAG: serine/threonine protein kinase [Deltaproteobacteria bacterium]